MDESKFIRLDVLVSQYQVEMTFIHSLQDFGLVNIVEVENTPCIELDCLEDVERMLRLHSELDINPAGIDAIHHLLARISEMQEELNQLRGRLNSEDVDF